MPNVNEAKAQQKWDALQKATSRPIEKLMAGAGSPADIRAAATSIGRFDQLARRIFLDGIQAIQDQADKYRDAEHAKRLAAGEKPLSDKKQQSAWDDIFQNILKSELPDIIGSVQDAIKESTKESIEDDPEFGAHLKSILSSVLKEQGVDNNLDDSKTGKSPIDAIRNMTGSNAVLTLNSATESAIVTSLSKQTVFHDEVIDTLKIIRKDADEDEGKKADSWFRRLRSWFGDKFSKAKKKAPSGWVKTLLGGLLLALTNPQLILGIVKAVKDFVNFDTIGKFLTDTWTTVKREGSSMVDSVLEMVGLKKSKEQLEKERVEGKRKAPSVIKQEDQRIAMLEQQIKNARAQHDREKASGRRLSPRNEKFLEEAPKQLELAKQARAKQVELLNSTGPLDKVIESSSQTPASFSMNSNVSQGDTTTTLSPMFSSSQKSVLNAANNVTVQSAIQPKWDPSDIFDPSNNFTVEASKPKSQQPLKTSSVVGLGSFSMTPGTTEQLQILNMSSLT